MAAARECFWEAEIHRLQGALQLLEGEDGGAEACFRRALEVACGHGARALELRAATSLSRLFVDSGRDEQAHRLLAPVYESFTEGFDTEDLRDAKCLIDSLPQ